MKLDAILLRQKLHQVAATKIACVNGPTKDIVGIPGGVPGEIPGGTPGGISDEFLSRILKVGFWAGLKKSLDY